MSVTPITFAATVRLMWIDDHIAGEGEIQRADIMRAFRMSVAQASLDLRTYQSLNPGRIAYDRSGKIYTRIDGSKPLFSAGDRLAAFQIVQAVMEH